MKRLAAFFLGAYLISTAATLVLDTPTTAAYAAKPVIKVKPAHKTPAKPAAKTPEAKSTETPDVPNNISYQKIESPLALIQNTPTWVGKAIEFEGTFNSFSPLGLDYKPAFRDSKNYLSFLVLRPDVTHHEIPLSELKMMFPRKRVNDVMELEAGDKVLVKGRVFSAALGDSWLDVDSIKILQKTPHSKLKNNKTANNHTPSKPAAAKGKTK